MEASTKQAETLLPEERIQKLCSSLGTHLCARNSDEHHHPRTRLDLLVSQNVALSKLVEQTQLSAFTFPLLSLFPPPTALADSAEYVHSPFKAQQIAIQNLGRPHFYEASRIDLAPNHMAISIASSFETLVEANLRHFFKIRALRDTPDKVCSSAEVSQEFNRAIYEDTSMGRRKLIRISSVQTSFFVKMKNSDESRLTSSREFDFPVTFKIIFTVVISNTPTVLSIDGPGSIKGLWFKDDMSQASKIDLTLNTGSLLKSLRLKARLVAMQAIKEVPSHFYSNLTPNEEFESVFRGAIPSNFRKRKRRISNNILPQLLGCPSFLIPPENPNRVGGNHPVCRLTQTRDTPNLKSKSPRAPPKKKRR